MFSVNCGMEEFGQKEYKRINVFILAGTFADLSVLDFSFLNIRCYNLKKTRRLKTLSDRYKPLAGEEYYSLLNIIRKDAEKTHDNLKYVHAMLPLSFDNPVSDEHFYGCVEVLKLLFPSDLQVHAIANFDIDNQENLEWSGTGYYHFHYSGKDRFDHYLYFQNKKEQIEPINRFIRLYFEKIGQMKYLRIAVDAYLNSFGDIPLHMSFISLCMALETFVDGKSELIYRIRRTVSLICADNQHVAYIIFQNLKKIYDLRSTIVHGDAYKYAQVKEYHPYLRSLISRSIVQLIHTDHKTATALQEALIFTGFTNRDVLFAADTISLNIMSYAETLSSLK